jgi:hypothetical protein
MDEKIKTEKRTWQKPELIVLVRSNPEEAVLSYCKFDGATGGRAGVGAINTGCNTNFYGCFHCSSKGIS